MGLKRWLKTRWNGDNQHKNELNIDKNMANSSKHKMTAFEIQTRDKCKPPPPPTPNSKGLIYGYTCSRLPSAPWTTNAVSCIYSYQKKRASSTDPEKPFIIALEHAILKLPSFSKVLGRFLLFTFFYPFPHQHLSTCACHADHVMILWRKSVSFNIILFTCIYVPII